MAGLDIIKGNMGRLGKYGQAGVRWVMPQGEQR